MNATIEKIEETILTLDIPGVFTEIKGNDVVYQFVSGFANRLQKHPNQLDTLFAVASGTKLFTALAIGKLIDEGKLHFETPALDILDLGNPELDRRMTIRHLLNHTSGLPDYLDESSAEQEENTINALPNESMLSPFDYLPFFPKKQNTSVPGAVFKYNNGAYVYLAMIIEKVTELSYETYISQALLVPIGLSRTGAYSVTDLPTNTAIGYYKEKNQWQDHLKKIPAKAGGDGGIYVTCMEMKRLWEAFLGGEIFSTDIIEQMVHPSVSVNSERKLYYGLGVWLKEETIDGVNVFIPYVTGSDVGISFKSSYRKKDRRFIFHVSNTSDGVWDLNQRINAFE